MRNKFKLWLREAFFAMGVVTLLLLILSKFFDIICIHFLEWIVLLTGVGAIFECIVHEYKLFSKNHVVRSVIIGLVSSMIGILTFDFDHYFPIDGFIYKLRLWIPAVASCVLVVACIGAVQEKLRIRGLEKINKKLEDMNGDKADK